MFFIWTITDCLWAGIVNVLDYRTYTWLGLLLAVSVPSIYFAKAIYMSDRCANAVSSCISQIP